MFRLYKQVVTGILLLQSTLKKKNKNACLFIQDDVSRVMRKPAFYICKNQHFTYANREADQRLCFATQIYFINPKFQASNHLLKLYSLVCVGPGRKPERWFSHDAAHMISSADKLLKYIRRFLSGFTLCQNINNKFEHHNS